MATITNRSNFVVSVPRHSKHERAFAYDAHADITAYVKQLDEQGFKPTIRQLEDQMNVRIRRVGYEEQNMTFKSAALADAFVKKVESDQMQGLFIDYTAANKISFASLIQRYITEVCPTLKGGGETTIYMLDALLDDSTNGLKKRIEMRKQEMLATGKAVTKLNANREPMSALEWVQLPLSQIKSQHIEDFIADRVQYVEPSSVDRQLDLMSVIFNLATTSWGYHLERNPMTGVRRPRYFNERDRRLKDGEEVLLLDAARREDQLRSMELKVSELVKTELVRAAQLTTHYARNEARKGAYDAARRQAIAEGFTHVPFFEAFVQFQIATAARRGETLGLFWERLDFHKKSAFLPTSKNGRPRHLAVRQDILDLVKRLPRSSDLVFDMGLAELVNAWTRMCEQAGIVDLHIHDLRHEGISRAAESGLFPTVIDLQAFSGHRDVRSLSRYAHLNPTILANRLEQAEQNRLESMDHKGRARLKTSELHWLGSAQSVPVEANEIAPARPQGTNALESVPESANVVLFRPRVVNAAV